MNRLVLPLAVLSAVFLMSCDEGPTDLDTENAPLLKPGGKPGKPGGGGGPATPEIAFLDRDGDITVMDADGGNVTVLVRRDDFGVNLHQPTWSPLGAGTQNDPYTLLFNVWPQLYEFEFYVDGSGAVSVWGWHPVETGTAKAFSAAYSPDGARMAFIGAEPSSCPAGSSFRSLYVMPADGTEPAVEVFCSTAPLGIGGPSWSPDGTAIVFNEEFDDDNLAVIGESAIRICNLTAEGCAISTAVDRTEADHLWGPEWLNDGSALLYTSSEGKWGSVMRVPLIYDGSGWIRVPGSTPEFVLSGRNPSSSPDDSQIIIDGLSIYDAATLEKTRAPRGTSPDWQVPVP